LATGISRTRYSMIERGVAHPTELECNRIETVLPPIAIEIIGPGHEHELLQSRSRRRNTRSSGN
jgi:hypothetical protein